MTAGNPITDLAAAIHHSCLVAFSEIEYNHISDWETKQKEIKTRKPSPHDIDDIHLFYQTWGSTAIGLGGIGGCAMTKATTIVIQHKDEYAVYFGGQFAYLLKNPNKVFFEDLGARHLVSKPQHTKYITGG